MESGANTRECLGGGMVDTRDLKSLGQQCPCEFESHPRHYVCGAYPRTPALAAQARFLNPSHFVTAPFRGMPARQASAGRLRCFDVCDISLTLRRAACAAPSGNRFPTLQSKVPRPRRSADADSLVKPFSDIFLLGISPDPCACCASALSQPQSLRDSPFQGHAGSASLRRASPLLRCLRHLADAPPRRLCGPLRESLSDFAEQSSATAPVR